MTKIKATVLLHKTIKGNHGMVKNGILYKSCSGIVPQLFPLYCTKEWLEKAIQISEKGTSLDDFDIVNVTLTYNKP
jgi:hypothetical protein